MSEQIKAQRIAEQFGSFLESKRVSRRSSLPFSQEVVKKLPAKESKERPQFSEKIRAARREQPPRLAKSRKITETQARRLASYAPHIEEAARKYNVPVELICGVILQESGAQHRAVSHCGARGLMQLMPGTAKRFGVTNSFDPKQNIDGGTKYLRWLLNKFKGDMSLALAGYNAGEHNVEKYGNKIPPFKETQNYVPGVMAYTQTMIDIFVSHKAAPPLPEHARRV
ncbi:MAG TPA: lytic transglycosylase domain-containing protein [bacterium]|nr:MAG: Soluble lytic murein transglycosylase precursor [bacterium ADurb.Bin270]HPW45658.1 lytic transglycosylase domain-containing protein [bacterium]